MGNKRTPQMLKCDALTRDGHKCMNWAMHGRTVCISHSKQIKNAGAPRGNQNAAKHNFYSKTLTPDELANLLPFATADDLTDELAIARIQLHRLMQRMKEPALAIDDLKSIVPLTNGTIRTIAHILRQKKGDTIEDVINDALDDLEQLLNTNL